MVVAVITIYHGWLSPGVIASGDWLALPDAHMRDYWPTLSVWNAAYGMGSANVLGLVFFPPLNLLGLLAYLGLSFSWAERLVYFFPAILGASLGGYVLSYSLFRRRLAAAITGLFLVCNSYIVIIDGGGQLTVGVAYALMPWILWSFRVMLFTNQRYHVVLTALLMAVQGVYDLRLTYITLAMLALYVPFIAADLSDRLRARHIVLRLGKLAIIWPIVELLIHSPWILPTFLVKGQAVAQPHGYNTVLEAHGLSFMLMAHGLSLLHPFWPLYPLGHVAPFDAFMFIPPLLIFALLLRARANGNVLYLYALVFAAIFFVKGANPPAGQVYDWLFLHLPGFSWFRDPSKFFQPLMVGAGTLLGLAVAAGAEWLAGCFSHGRAYPLTVLWIGFWLFAVTYPAFPGIVALREGTMTPWRIPAEYTQLDKMIEHQQEPFSVLWYPGFPRYGTYSERHPVLDASGVGATHFPSWQLPNGNPTSWLGMAGAIDTLQALSVKYVVVPSDPFHEMYSSGTGMSYQSALAQARRYLKGFRETRIGAIHIFANPHYLPLVYVPAHVTARDAPPAGSEPTVPPIAYVTMPRPATGLPSFATTVAGAVPGSHVDPQHFNYDIPPRSLPAIRVERTNTSQIEVNVRSATRPFMLLLLQSYDPNWRAYILPTGTAPSWWSLWHRQPVPARDHLQGAGYGNAWRISAHGSFTVMLLFWPQILVTLGGIVCWLTILACAGYVGFGWWTTRYKGSVGWLSQCTQLRAARAVAIAVESESQANRAGVVKKKRINALMHRYIGRLQEWK